MKKFSIFLAAGFVLNLCTGAFADEAGGLQDFFQEAAEQHKINQKKYEDGMNEYRENVKKIQAQGKEITDAIKKNTKKVKWLSWGSPEIKEVNKQFADVTYGEMGEFSDEGANLATKNMTVEVKLFYKDRNNPEDYEKNKYIQTRAYYFTLVKGQNKQKSAPLRRLFYKDGILVRVVMLKTKEAQEEAKQLTSGLNKVIKGIKEYKPKKK